MKVMDTEDLTVYLAPTRHIDSDDPSIIEYARSAADGADTDIDRGVKIFYAVRDDITYDPYHIDLAPDKFRASVVLAKKSGYCVEKAVLLAACARALHIPSRLRFTDVRNHLTTAQLKKIMGTDIFIYHGFTELLLNNRWVKATPTFNISLCERFGVHPLEFDGIHDSIFHEFDMKGSRHMEYVHDHGSFADLPYEKLIKLMKKHYPSFFERSAEDMDRNFAEEAHTERKKSL